MLLFDSGNGTATTYGSGSSSNFRSQEFGDLLGTGGTSSSGSLAYSVSSSDADVTTTIEAGTETVGGEVSTANAPVFNPTPEYSASYGTTSTLIDGAADDESGTESLGPGASSAAGSRPSPGTRATR